MKFVGMMVIISASLEYKRHTSIEPDELMSMRSKENTDTPFARKYSINGFSTKIWLDETFQDKLVDNGLLLEKAL